MAHFSQNIHYIIVPLLKNIFFISHFKSFFGVYVLAFSCISYNSTIDTLPFKISVEVYPIEACLMGKCVVEVSGCHHTALAVWGPADLQGKVYIS
jgi:hypothetical protein